KSGFSLLWPADSGLPERIGNRYDPGPRVQGSRALSQNPVGRSTHRVATPIKNFASMDSPLRIAVVGSGIGASHIEGFQELPNLFDIKMLCDVNRERATAVAEKYRIQEV